MTGATLVSSVLATAAVILLIIGYIHEDRVIAFEDRLILALARIWKRHMRRRRIRQRAKAGAHLRVISSAEQPRRCSRSA